MADLRFSPERLLQDDFHPDALWQQFYLLMNATKILVSEGIIEPATADLLQQVGLDFKVTIQALELANQTLGKTEAEIEP